MTQSDRAFHALARHEPDIVLATLRVLCPRVVARATPVRLEDLQPTRLDALAPPLDADWLARVGPSSLLHLECQGYRDEGFVERLFRYHLLLTLQHPERVVQTVALWLTRPPATQRRGVFVHGDLTLRVTHVVLAEVPARRLLASPQTACFAPGADARAMGDEALCDAAARALASVGASWYQRHMAAVAAHTRGRYEVMTRAMSHAGIEPILIEDLLNIGEDRGIAKATAEATLTLADARGLVLTDAQRASVQKCTDIDTLKRWFRRAVTAASADEVFEDK